MPRPKKLRKVGTPPAVPGFKPIGARRRDLANVVLNLDEYEAIKLADYRDSSHKEAAKKIGVSRPTFSRLIESAHKKISQALIEGKEIVIEGGNIHFDKFLYICKDCGYRFIKKVDEKVDSCPECGSENLLNQAEHFGHGNGCCRRYRHRGRNRRGR